jgi:hypothetical protein
VQCSKIDAEELNHYRKAYRNRRNFPTALHQKGKLAHPMREKPSPSALSPGDFVRHPGRPDWGLGQIQSMIGHRITVNFENAGKVVIDGSVIELEPAEPPPP